MALLLIALSLASMASQAQEPVGNSLRDRLRERLQQRQARATATSEADSTTRLGPGTHTLTVTHAGLSRKVLVHVPPGATGGPPSALVLAFHGGGGSAETMADDERYGLSRKADAEGFVVAYPNGYSRFPGGRLATWNAGLCCGEARDRQVDDVGYARAVVAAIAARVDVDPERVFATGMSNGGMLSHRLACEASDVFRAVAAVAGTDVGTSCSPAQPVSVLHIHARDDDHVLFEGGAGPGAFRDASKVTAFTSVPETMARWVQRAHCSAQPRRVLGRTGAYCEAYTDCTGGATVQLCVTEQGGHSWPGAGSARRGQTASSQALQANDVIWDFFLHAGAKR